MLWHYISGLYEQPITMAEHQFGLTVQHLIHYHI